MESTAGKANPDDKTRPTCQDCGQTFSVKKSLYRHQRGRCPTDREKSESHPKEQEERSPKALREAVPTRPTTQPMCTDCRKTFSSTDHVKRHLNGRCRYQSAIGKMDVQQIPLSADKTKMSQQWI